MSNFEVVQQYYIANDVDQFFKYVDTVMDALRQTRRYEELTTLANDKAVFYYRANNLSLASQTLSDYALLIEEFGNTKQQIRYFNTLAAIQGLNHQHEEVYNYLMIAQRLAEKVDDREMLVHIYLNISTYLYEIENYEESLLYIRKSTAYTSDFTFPQTLMLSMQMKKAKIWMHLAHFEKAQQILSGISAEVAMLNDAKTTVRFQMAKAELLQCEHRWQDAYDILLDTLKRQTSPILRKDLYGVICPLAKKVCSSEMYIEHLKNWYEVKQLVIKQNNEQQIQEIFSYFNEEPYKQATWTDTLTGVYNRRYLQEHYAHFEKGTCILLFDVDHFKTINDSYGHVAGDEVLRKVSKIARRYFQKLNGLFVRLGGDEFVAILPVNDAKQAKTTLQTLQQAVQQLKVPLSKDSGIHVTVSVGAIYNETQDDLPLQNMLQLADEALYMSKNNGRNQYTIKVV